MTPDVAESRARVYDPAPPCTMVIFGAGGDLTKRLVTPALYNLSCAKMLSQEFEVIGLDIADQSDESWHATLKAMVTQFVKGGAVDEDKCRWLMDRMHYMQGDFSKPDLFKNLAGKLGDRNVLFYLAVPDRFFGPIISRLSEAGLTHEPDGGHWRRIIVEKPFGHDLDSARALNAEILKAVDEHQIFRMDHFLGKETVQNIMMLRFGNNAFESLWNREQIDHVQITVSESVGVESRGKFYEVTGALRDMVPNHVFQLLATVAMEPPVSFDADAVRAEKAKVLQAVHSFSAEDVEKNVVRGQYGAGGDGKAYREEPDVSASSDTETYVAFKLHVDNWRWGGVPFYIRTGKHMAARKTEIMLQFRHPPFTLFRDTEIESLPANRLILHIQPDEGISLQFNAKIPGPAVDAKNVRMDFRYKDFFQETPSTGYEILLYDCMIGDATLFQRADFVEAGWRIVQPILDVWKNSKPDFPNYASFSQGPAAADDLLARDGRTWRKLA